MARTEFWFGSVGSITYLGLPLGASFWPLNDDHPDAPAAAAEPQEEETGDGLRQADAELSVGNGEGEGEGNAGSASPPQLLHSGPEWRQQNHTGAFYYSAPRPALRQPVPDVFSPVAPALLQDFPFVYPYAYSDPALHLAYPYVAPHFSYVAPYFALANPYTLHIATSAYPLAHPNPYLYSALSDNPSFPTSDPHGVIGQLWEREPQEDAFYDETDEEEGSGIPGFHSLSFAGSVENIGPLWDGDAYEEFSFSGFSPSFSEDTESPSTSGLGSSARRRKDSSTEEEEEAANKKPRWSNDGDSD